MGERMKRLTDFYGFSFRAEKVLAVGPVQRVSTGPLAIQGGWGFDIIFAGATHTLVSRVGRDNVPKDDEERASWIRAAVTIRSELLEIIEQLGEQNVIDE